MTQRIFERVRRIELRSASRRRTTSPGAHDTGQPATTGANAGAAGAPRSERQSSV